MKNKIIGLTITTLFLTSCGKPNESKVIFNKGDTKITYSDHQMAVQQSCTNYTEVATISSSVLNGNKLQATAIIEDSGYMFVSYNTQFDAIRGGLDIIQLNTNLSLNLKSSLISENTEFADLKKKGDVVFLSGQRKGLSRNYATLVAVNVSNKTNPQIISSIDLDGYYATSLELDNNKILTTVPNLGVVSLSFNNNQFTIDNIQHIEGNSLYVQKSSNKQFVLGGDQSHKLSVKSNNVLESFSISSLTQEAPSRFTIKGNVLFTNGGNSGLSIFDKVNSNNMSKVHSSPLQGTGNGIAYGECNQLFLAQGEAGLQIKDVQDLNNPTHVGEFDYLNDHGSANNVFFIKYQNHRIVLVADGLAGVKVVKMQINNGCVCSESSDDSGEDDDLCDEQKTEGLLCKVYDLTSMKDTLQNVPNFSTLTPVGEFRTEKLNVIAQSSDNSFPLFPNSLSNMKTWYGIKCEGYWNSTYEGSGKIALASDDGSKLLLDDLLVLNNDGLHSPTTKETDFFFNKRKYKVKLEYFQGPASQIQLELKFKKGNNVYEYMDNMFTL